ncbi:MAG: acetylxylan esterase [Planctomycetaceae bacterium]|jgi:hypothetical protein|nr:acetylxylan esterase [Planctomycetaceae bacterium]
MPNDHGVGLQDQICPPTTSFATFNRIPGRKTHRIYVNRGHGMDDEHWLWVWNQIESEVPFEQAVVATTLIRKRSLAKSVI